jgi:hypothetical protein
MQSLSDDQISRQDFVDRQVPYPAKEGSAGKEAQLKITFHLREALPCGHGASQ